MGLKVFLPLVGGLAPLCALALLASAAGSQPSGPGGLLVGPTRVVLEGSRRSAQLTVVNTGPRTATYRISLVRMEMSESGSFRELPVSDSASGYADTLLRFSPRRVELPPQVPQAVRVQLRLPPDLPEGEYRSHLLFRAVPDADTSAQDPQVAAGGLELRLRPIYGVSIPVIVRVGRTSARIGLSGLALQSRPGSEPSTTLRVVLDRSGNRSVYGNLTATLVQHGAADEVVGIARGVAVYSTNPRRVFDLALRLPPAVRTPSSLRVTFADLSGEPDAQAAQASLELR